MSTHRALRPGQGRRSHHGGATTREPLPPRNVPTHAPRPGWRFGQRPSFAPRWSWGCQGHCMAARADTSPRARVWRRGEGSWLEARIVARDTIADHQLIVRHLAGPGFDPLLKIHPGIFRIPSWCRTIPARVLNPARWPSTQSPELAEEKVRKGFVKPEEYQAILCHLP